MNEYASVYTIKDTTVYDNGKEYMIDSTSELIETPDMYKPVAAAVYRLYDEIFGERYKVELKPEYKGIVARYDRPLSVDAFESIRNRYFIEKLQRRM